MQLIHYHTPLPGVAYIPDPEKEFTYRMSYDVLREQIVEFALRYKDDIGFSEVEKLAQRCLSFCAGRNVKVVAACSENTMYKKLLHVAVTDADLVVILFVDRKNGWSKERFQNMISFLRTLTSPIHNVLHYDVIAMHLPYTCEKIIAQKDTVLDCDATMMIEEMIAHPF